MARRLYRSQRERIIGGVAGGLGEYFDIDPVWVRLAFVLLTFASGIGIIAYAVLWISVPRQSSQAMGRQAVQENVADIKENLKQAQSTLKSAFSEKEEAAPETPETQERGRSTYIVGIILMVAGGILLLSNLATFWWFSWGRFWPVLLIAAGVVILLARRGK
ncbi:MAG: PspC domain-containing protein [Chloroflexi bacterium]|nr:PspC domain-containing protein [Chloroflexota bacterium]